MSSMHRTGPVLVIVLAVLTAASGGEQALWRDGSARLRPEAEEAIALLRGAAAEGLDPREYPVPPPDAASFDSELTASTLRYLEHLRFGRVDPRALGFGIPPRESVDLAAMLRDAVAAHRLSSLAADLAPAVPMYAQLRGELARYRALAAAAVPCDDLPALLTALGDRRDAAPGEAELADAVARFQVRHGLDPDGIVGPATRKALATPLDWRVRQIEFSLERLRWLPRFAPQKILAVNIPMYRVWAMGGAGVPPFSTEVIVGRALKTRTPVLVESMEYVIFRPYWNIPSSILRGEILPALRRDPGYLQRHAMEIVSGEPDAARALPATEENLARLRQGTVRLRQRPGRQNSLGLIKFVFPNDRNVYLHGTPAQELFARPRRDFSHGCIRVADPVALAQWVLASEGEWTRERIVSAMDGPDSTRVDLRRPIPVILFYLTAMPIGGALHFADDVYGHDARLDRYLAARTPQAMTSR